MKQFLQSTIVFLGTLLAAALVAIGEPAEAEVQMTVQPAESAAIVVGLLAQGQ